MVFLYVCGWRNDAISIISREVMNPRGLIVTGLDTMDQSGPDIAAVNNSLPPPPSPPLSLTPLQHQVFPREQPPNKQQALRTFTDPARLPALTHCTLGKDRTGLITTLTLLTLGAPLDAIEHDYALTDAELEPRLKATAADLALLGLAPEWGVTAPDMVARIKGHLKERYGGLEGYLDGIGFGEDERDALREALLY